MVRLCLLAGLYFSFGTRFIQVRRIGEMVRLLFKNDKSKKEGISSFQAFTLALSGRVGTGNIVGVALAIGYGGPGAIVWMWIIAFFGAGTAFAEATLAQIYKERQDGQLRGGPAYYIEKGLRCKWLAVIFAVATALACSFCMPPIHTNGIASSFASTFGIAPWIVGLGVSVLIALVVMGGVKRISAVAEIVSPFMAIAYILLSIVVLIANAAAVPEAFSTMISCAFGYHQALGGIMGSAIAWGVKRGIYSNEAGQGTAPIVAAAAKVDHPVKQGLVQGFSVYVDTLLVCSATALMILATNSYAIFDNGGALIYAAGEQGFAAPGVEYTIAALGSVLGAKWGGIAVSVTLFFFAFTTIMAFYYYAETNLIYLMRGRTKAQRVWVWVLRCVFVGAVMMGAMKETKVIWDLGDTGVGTMAWINIIAILLLSPKAFKALRDYEKQKKAGNKNPVFKPKDLGIKNADFWEDQD